MAECLFCQADARESEVEAQERRNCFSAEGMHWFKFEYSQDEDTSDIS
ncbi:hypothetical protein FH587_20050 [Leptospira interrogans]|nr:hypothetical protein [Leptospira interrogans]UML84267.1 hypothetical protein FH587_19970 [Leptospira interrogans]UML84283.1 hypothetical protein FH587_20050 [Leptospira interrogans]